MSSIRGDRERRLLAERDARIIRDLEETYRSWTIFVREERARLQQAQADDDLTSPRDTGRRSSALRRDRWRELERVFEARRRQLGYAADARGRSQLLDRIGSELEGTAPDAEGQALLWYGDRLISFNHRALSGRMASGDFATAGPSRSTIIVAGASIAGVLCLMVVAVRLFLWLSSPLSYAPDGGPITIGDAELTPEPVRSIELNGLRVEGEWFPGAPALLCAANPQVSVPLTTTLVLRRDGMVQVYGANADAPADLLVADCEQRPPRTLASFRLQDGPVLSADPAPSVLSVLVSGVESAPLAIADDQMLVEIVVDDARLQESVLILGDGTRWANTEAAWVDAGLRLRFLIPRQDAAQEGALESGETTPQPVAVVLPPPISRIELLQRQVMVELQDVQPSLEGGLTVTTRLTLAEDAPPLSLLPDDVQIEGSTELPAWAPPSLRPGESINAVIELGGVSGEEQTLLVAGRRYRIRP